MLWFAGALALLFYAASASRRRKQKLVEKAWRDAVEQGLAHHYAIHFGEFDRPISPAEAANLADHFFAVLYRRMQARNFPDLMRALVVANRNGEDTSLEIEMADAVAAMVPGATDSIYRAGQAAQLRRVLSAAGQKAMTVGRSSGEV